MKYELASSSTEEGEVQQKSFPFNKSHLKYYYYPTTYRFIGKNTIPNGMDYKLDNNISQKIKKELKNDYPYLQFNLIDSHRLFFDNKFKLVGSLEEKEVQLSLKDTKSNLKEIKNFLQKTTCENLYEKFFQKVFFNREERQEISPKITKIFVLEDKILNYFNSQNAYIFLRVSEDSPLEEHSKKQLKKYAFEEVFFNQCSFYEMLGLYQDKLLKSFNSEEIQTFSNKNTIFYVYSSTTYRDGNKIHRIYDNINSSKNTMLLFNKTEVTSFEIDGIPSNVHKYLYSLDLPTGDYVINNKQIYKMCNDGEAFEFKGFNYDKFNPTV